MSIGNKQMVAYWRKRVAELEAMRPILPPEALAMAAAEEQSAADCQRRLDESRAQEMLTERGRLTDGDTLAARGMRNAEHIASCREAVWGEETRRVQHLLRAEAYRRVAASPIGAPLHESLNEARRRLAYYESLAARS